MSEATNIPDLMRQKHKRMLLAAPHAEITLFIGQGLCNSYFDHAQRANTISPEYAPLKSFSDPDDPLVDPVYVAAVKSEHVRRLIDAATAKFSVALIDVAANGSFVTLCHIPRRKGDAVEDATVAAPKASEPEEEDFL